MDVTKPFFTVLIPTFNRKEFLKGAVRSVMDQTFEDFEILIVDDHSTDETAEIIPQFGDDRIKYVVNHHTKGLSGARNTGMDLASGKWTAFLDDDDLWFPDKLDKVRKKIEEVDEQTGLIYTGFTYFDPYLKRGGYFKKLPSKEGWVQKDLLYRNFIGTPSVVSVRTDIFRLAGGCDESFCYFEDGDLYVRVSGLSKVVFIDEVLTFMRTTNSDRLSFKYDRRMSGFKKFMEKHGSLLEKSARLKHRAASRVFVYAMLQGEVAEAVKALPWTLAGIAVDRPNMAWILKCMASPLVRAIRGF